MLDVAPTELLLVALVALVVIGPKDLPRAMRFVGQWVARARGVARHFRSGIDEMIRQSELEEMEKKWAAENERIMREHPPQPQLIEGEMLPLAAPAEPAPLSEDPGHEAPAQTVSGDFPSEPAGSDQPKLPLAAPRQP